MRVLMLHPHDLRYDPWTIRIIALAQGIIARGHQAVVAYLPKKKIHQHDRLLRDELPQSPPVVALHPRHSDLNKNYQMLLRLSSECDIVHIQKCFASVACPGLWAAYRRGKPVHLDWDDNESILADLTAPDRLWAHLIKTWENKIPSLVDSLSVASDGIRELAVGLGVPESHICKIPVGADLQQFHPDRAEPGLRAALGLGPESVLTVYCGQLEGAAYAELAVDAMEIVHARNPNVHLVVVGGGKGLPGLRKRIDEEGIRTITLTGYIPAHEVPRYLASADITLACFEDNAATRCKSPLKIAEYLASGCPIVGSAVGEVPEMIGDAGILAPPGNAEALAEGILRYAGDPELRKQHRARARHRAESIYHWQRSADVLLGAYAKVLQ